MASGTWWNLGGCVSGISCTREKQGFCGAMLLRKVGPASSSKTSPACNQVVQKSLPTLQLTLDSFIKSVSVRPGQSA